jgi:thiol-disulfide isomerase/thioredoxin
MINALKIFFILLISIAVSAQDGKKMELTEAIRTCLTSSKMDGSISDKVSECLNNTEFPFFMVVDLDEEVITSHSLDQITIINYWFIECPPCKVEKGFLTKLNEEYSGLNILSLCRNSKNELKEEIKKAKLPEWDYVYDYENQNVSLNTFGYPMTIILDNNRRVRKVFVGGIVDEEKYEKAKSVINDVKNG